MARNNTLLIEDAKICFKNFSGKAGQYNEEGDRNFCVILDPDLARTLQEDGWNVKYLRPKDEGDMDQPYLQVTVKYDNFPPKIVLISSRGKTILNEETVGILDWAEIQEIDLSINPYNWTMYKNTKNERNGIKAYAKSLYVTIVEDEFEKKYINVPDSASDIIGGCGNCDACDGTCGHNH